MTQLNKNRDKTADIIILILLVLGAMNFMLLGVYLVLGAFVVCLILRRGVFLTDTTGFWLMALAVSFVAFEMITTLSFNLRIIVAPCAYLLAYNYSGDKDEDYPVKMLAVIAFSMAIHGVLSFLYTFSVIGLAGFISGRSLDIWSQTLTTSTGVASNYYFMVALIPLLFSNASHLLKWSYGALLAVCMVHNLLIGGRTVVVLSALVLVVYFAAALVRKGGFRKLLKIGIFLLLALGGILVLYEQDIFGVKTIFESSYMYWRFFASYAMENITSTGRWEIKLAYLQNMFRYPFGGYHISDEIVHQYAHDVWLDTLDAAGIVTMLIMLVYTVGSVFRFFRYARTWDSLSYQRLLFFILPIAMMAAFFVEPILNSAPIVFFMYCFLDGAISRQMQKRERGL